MSKFTKLSLLVALPLLLAAGKCDSECEKCKQGQLPADFCAVLEASGKCESAPTPTPVPAPTPCPPGTCQIGETNTVPPAPICGACPPPVEDCRTTGCPPRETCKLSHGGWSCVADEPPPPPVKVCPKDLAPGTEVYMNNKAYGLGFDSTVRVRGDKEFCQLIHGVPVDDCHLEGWPTRVECEMQLIGGCPVWQYQTSTQGPTTCVDDHDAAASCDHFGNVEYRDDPQTPTTGNTLETLKGFEGQPQECGLQRDTNGPLAGFFVIAHGEGQVRACKPVGGGCGPWRPFNH